MLYENTAASNTSSCQWKLSFHRYFVNFNALNMTKFWKMSKSRFYRPRQYKNGWNTHAEDNLSSDLLSDEKTPKDRNGNAASNQQHEPSSTCESTGEEGEQNKVTLGHCRHSRSSTHYIVALGMILPVCQRPSRDRNAVQWKLGRFRKKYIPVSTNIEWKGNQNSTQHYVLNCTTWVRERCWANYQTHKQIHTFYYTN